MRRQYSVLEIIDTYRFIVLVRWIDIYRDDRSEELIHHCWGLGIRCNEDSGINKISSFVRGYQNVKTRRINNIAK